MVTRNMHIQETPGITKWHIASEVETKRKLSFEGLFQRKILSDVKHIRFEETRLLALLYYCVIFLEGIGIFLTSLLLRDGMGCLVI